MRGWTRHEWKIMSITQDLINNIHDNNEEIYAKLNILIQETTDKITKVDKTLQDNL